MSLTDPLTEPERALELILGGRVPLEPEEVAVEEAVGRALCDDVLAVRTLPPWNNSAVDGYAVRSAEVAQVPTRLPVGQVVPAGHRPRPLRPKEAAQVMTGAQLPPGADAVVMQERTTRFGQEVEILEAPVLGQFVRAEGEDARRGGLLLPSGTAVGVPEAALLWAQGLTRVKVPRRPTVAILASGDELCRPGEAEGDLIVDTNSPQLALCAGRVGALPTLLGIAPDDADALTALVARALEYDVVLTSAGVSVGERDFVREALRRLGVKVHFWRVAIRPGKPLLFGTCGKSMVFGLPGNPASSLVTFELFVRPALRRLLGHPSPGWSFISGRLDVPLRKKAGLTHYLRATATFRDGELWATPLSTQTSGAIRSLAQATHLIVLPSGATEVGAGDQVTLLPIFWGG